jgi:hypothetical protein
MVRYTIAFGGLKSKSKSKRAGKKKPTGNPQINRLGKILERLKNGKTLTPLQIINLQQYFGTQMIPIGGQNSILVPSPPTKK